MLLFCGALTWNFNQNGSCEKFAKWDQFTKRGPYSLTGTACTSEPIIKQTGLTTLNNADETKTGDVRVLSCATNKSVVLRNVLFWNAQVLRSCVVEEFSGLWNYLSVELSLQENNTSWSSWFSSRLWCCTETKTDADVSDQVSGTQVPTKKRKCDPHNLQSKTCLCRSWLRFLFKQFKSRF